MATDSANPKAGAGSLKRFEVMLTQSPANSDELAVAAGGATALLLPPLRPSRPLREKRIVSRHGRQGRTGRATAKNPLGRLRALLAPNDQLQRPAPVPERGKHDHCPNDHYAPTNPGAGAGSLERTR